ncbi:aspartyl-tRNA synthetase [Phanerochaete sordida]|uniref:Aspartyl-tRNA synthetase n=1 Tax=Phanerochaete sordida TaxID=48140 RepID=A0A9P3FXX3_9APHY|nr:aspartyl-tRNA synthetase [Phanerochaete sordida]
MCTPARALTARVIKATFGRSLPARSPKPWPRTFGTAAARLQSASPDGARSDEGRVADKSNALKAHNAPFPQRSHHCGSLSAKDAGSSVTLTGWLLPGRKVGKGFYFYPLKDPHGTVQLVVPATVGAETLELMRNIPVESTVLVEGLVSERPQNQKRPQPGGDIEVTISSCTLLNPAEQPLPFVPSDEHNLPAEEFRLRHRYLDLRRSILSGNLQKRSRVAHLIRTTLHDHGFVEVETPVLLKSTPEGAREFLVPTRTSASTPSVESSIGANPREACREPHFYALPQSPQQPKQLLIASGAVDRYYQIAKCFRDEDGRKDRQPEFTQVDMEMAWVSWGDRAANAGDNAWRIGGKEVREIIERLIRKIWLTVEGIELPSSFTVMTYEEAMGRFGSDKPDTRFGLELQLVTDRLSVPVKDAFANEDQVAEALVVRSTDTQYKSATKSKQLYEAAMRDGADMVRVLSDGTVKVASSVGSSGTFGTPHSITDALQLQPGDTAWLAKRRRAPEGGSTVLGRLRLLLSTEAQAAGQLVLPAAPHFLWVTEFPLFTRADPDKEFLANGRWSSSHHPFTAPMWEDIEKLYDGRLAEVRGQHYDLVLNGMEIGGGSVRVHDAEMQEHIFTEILQLHEQEKTSFNHLLHALRCGAPPHGGIALGFDRLMAILCKTESIRDVIAFPKTGAGTDLLFKSPAPVAHGVLQQYNIRPGSSS